jgi:hypothetical protein
LCFWRFAAVVALTLAGLAAGPTSVALGQDALSVDQLRHDFDTRYKDELVTVRGWVDTERRVASRTFKGFYLKDRYGALILIRTTKALPDITVEIVVRGVAIRDAESGDIFLSEVSREPVSAVGRVLPMGAPDAESLLRQQADTARRQTEEARKQAEEAARRVQEAERQAAEARRRAEEEKLRLEREQAAARAEAEATRQRLVIALVAVGGLALLVGAVLLFRRKSVETTTPAGNVPGMPPLSPAAPSAPLSTAPPAPAAGTTVQDFKTVKVFKTTKVWPGRLVVLENKQETDVIPLSDQSGRGEVEIGRDSPDATVGIRIKDKTNTLSRKQARIEYTPDRREFRLVNLAGEGSNPTAFNGRQMKENESVVLKDGDVLLMGSIEMKFRQ